MSSHDQSTNEEINSVKMKRPHIVVLGAGASRATCPNGDKNGKKIPLMNDLVDVLNLRQTFNRWNIDPQQNFEDIYSNLNERHEQKKLHAIECAVEKYVIQLRLPDMPTLYDHLVLSLTKNDLIASFNWDPLLLQAYRRNQNSGLTLPKLAFLHGNAAVGFCEKDKIYGNFGGSCTTCNKSFKRMKLLYPTKEKNYTNNILIRGFWNMFKNHYMNAFMITIFGYSAPKTDTEARSAMKEVFNEKRTNEFDQIELITTQNKDAVYNNWKPFIHTHHYDIYGDFYDSFLAKHPRRTGDAYWAQTMDGKFIEDNPIPTTHHFPQLWSWFERFKNAENMN